jgi:hypothetical protein
MAEELLAPQEHCASIELRFHSVCVCPIMDVIVLPTYATKASGEV